MGSNLLNCQISGWVKGKDLTNYSYRNKSHLLIGNSIAVAIKQGWTEQLQQQDHYFHTIPFTLTLFCLNLFSLIHLQKIMQCHLNNIIPHNGMLWVNAAAVLYFPYLLYSFSLLCFFKNTTTSWNPALINLITYLWLVGKNVVKISCMYKNSLRLLGFAALFPYYSNVILRIVWLNILPKHTFIHAFTTKTGFF